MANQVSAAIASLNANEHGKSKSYLDKKGSPSGEMAMLNALPPGQDIFNQSVADLSPESSMVFKEIVNSKGYATGIAGKK